MTGSDAPLAPVKAEVKSGLDRVQELIKGGGFAELTAGVVKPYDGELDGFVRGEVGYKPTDTTSFFGFVEATLKQAQAGLGFRKDF